MRVLVVGGGLGGLCLAQGPRRHGVDVNAGTRRQGYRLHLGRRAASALRECLPRERYARFEAVTGTPSRRITVLSAPSVTAAVGAYEARMTATGFAAVRASLKAARGPAWLSAFLAVRRFLARR